MFAALTTARKAFGGGTLSSVQEVYHGTMWEVRVIDPDGTERKVHTAADGRTVSRGVEPHAVDAEDAADNRQRTANLHVSLIEAAKHIRQAVPGGLSEIELDDDHGQVIWDATIDTDNGPREVQLDADSGAIVSDTISD